MTHIHYQGILDYARSQGHDPEGVARDPEGIRFLADAKWKQGLKDSWWGLVNAVRTLEGLTEEDREWLREQDRRAVEIVGFSLPAR